jgi:hypothetical protein
MSQTTTKIEISGMAALPVNVMNWGKVPYSQEGYTVTRISETRGLYRLQINSIAQTGAAVNTRFSLPTECRIEKLGWTHTTVIPTTLSADALTITVDLYVRGTAIAPVRLHAYTGTASNDIEAYDFTEPAEQVLVQTTTTNTDLIHFYMDIEVKGDPQ